MALEELVVLGVLPASLISSSGEVNIEALTDYILKFSKVARGNHLDDGLRDLTDDDIKAELSGLKGNLSKDQKKLQKEEKARGARNKQKKDGKKGTGTGRQ